MPSKINQMVQKDKFPLHWDFCFQCTLAQQKIWKKKLRLLHFRLVMVKYLLGDMVSQSLQSSLSSLNFHYLKQFPQKRAIRKSILVTNAGIAAWVVKQQIVVNQGFFVMLVLKIEHYVLNHVSSCTMKLSKIEFMRSDWTVTKYWFMFNVYDNDP